MGHFLFIVLHLAAIFFMPVGLFVTVPLHVLYGVMSKPKVSPSTLVKCPDCRELVNREANVCKHCGCKLVPASDQPDQPLSDRLFNGRRSEGVKAP